MKGILKNATKPSPRQPDGESDAKPPAASKTHAHTNLMPTSSPPKLYSSLPPYPSYFRPSFYQVKVHFPGDGRAGGSIYTQGLHKRGYPEFLARDVPHERTQIVVKNLYFLASRMVSGVKIEAGHKSTDWDYRVKINLVKQEGYRKSILFHCMPGSDPSSAVFELTPYYDDCEEWGSFPPAPANDRERRNRLVGAVLFPPSAATPTSPPRPQVSYTEDDAAYLIMYIDHFEYVLQVQGAKQLLDRMPLELQGLVGHLLSEPQVPVPTSAQASAPLVAKRKENVPPAAARVLKKAPRSEAVLKRPAKKPKNLAVQDKENTTPARTLPSKKPQHSKVLKKPALAIKTEI